MTENMHREVRVHIDLHPHHSPDPTTGAALYALGKVRPDYVLYREVEGDWEDKPVINDESPVHLKEDEHFHSAESEHHKEPRVDFEDVNSSESTHFRQPWDTKLTDAWNEAAWRLEEPRKPDDRLQTPAGVSLMSHLELTLRQLKERKIITELKFLIVGRTGGA